MVSVTSVEVWPLSAALLSVSEAAELVSELVSELASPAEEEDSLVDPPQAVKLRAMARVNRMAVIRLRILHSTPFL